MNVLVTGGAGYIGSHVVLQLLAHDHRVVVIDDLSTGQKELVDRRAHLVVGDVGDATKVARVLDEHHIDAVLHFAGSIVVPESIDHPLKYYLNNSAKTRTLLETCVANGVGQFVFSSTAAVYGEPEATPVSESAPTTPINPYGRSKLITEWMLEDIANAYDLRFVALRYFNVAGADPQGRTGQATPNATHLLKVAAEAALGIRPGLEIFGTDYSTPDGTCIRDFIHVSDLAHIHVRALDFLANGGSSQTLNCGYGRGFSVRQVVDAVQRVSGEDFPIKEGARRVGDPPKIIADPSALQERFDWRPRFDDLDKIVATALAWEKTWRAGAVNRDMENAET